MSDKQVNTKEAPIEAGIMTGNMNLMIAYALRLTGDADKKRNATAYNIIQDLYYDDPTKFLKRAHCLTVSSLVHENLEHYIGSDEINNDFGRFLTLVDISVGKMDSLNSKKKLVESDDENAVVKFLQENYSDISNRCLRDIITKLFEKNLDVIQFVRSFVETNLEEEHTLRQIFARIDKTKNEIERNLQRSKTDSDQDDSNEIDSDRGDTQEEDDNDNTMEIPDRQKGREEITLDSTDPLKKACIMSILVLEKEQIETLEQKYMETFRK